MALLAAAAEGVACESIEQLVAAAVLPPGFGPRPDGSQVALEEGEAVDSLRGRRGRFLPVPDVAVERVTPSEAQSYRKFIEICQAEWGAPDPLMVGMKRQPQPENREHVVVDVVASPFAKRHVDLLSQWIGRSDEMQLAPIPQDLAAGEVVLSDQRLFGGLWDFGLPFRLADGRFVPSGPLRDTIVGYVGAAGEMSLLGFLDRMITGPPDRSGYAGGELGIWRRYYRPFTVFSLHRQVLETVTPQLRFEKAERPAQFRLRVGDISRARLTPAINTLSYLRTRDTSLGNVRLMHALNQQLHVPGPDCKTAAELLLGATLVCPLGGEYVWREADDGGGWWTSTALDESTGESVLDVRVPPGYQAPPLTWFRGLVLDATMTGDRLSAHAEIDMQMPEAPP
jgi:hypothetical protein